MVNPKKAFGMAKPPLHLIPPSAMIHAAMSFKDGAQKYGPYNWRTTKVDATTYAAAAKRHLELWFHGQELTSDSKVHNLGAVIACCAILLDAQDFGFLEDDRPPAVDLEKVMKEWTAPMKASPLNEALAETARATSVLESNPMFRVDTERNTVEMLNVRIDGFVVKDPSADLVDWDKFYKELVTIATRDGGKQAVLGGLLQFVKPLAKKYNLDPNGFEKVYADWDLRGRSNAYWNVDIGKPMHKEQFIRLARKHVRRG